MNPKSMLKKNKTIKRQYNFRMDEETYKAIKIKLINENKNLSKWLISIIENYVGKND